MIHLDVAGGTGDIGFRSLSALRAAEASARDSSFHAPNLGPKPGRIIVCDINSHMLVEGKRRAGQLDLTNSTDRQGNRLATINFKEGNAENLPLDDGSVDLYTIVFGLRNVTDTLAALKDARRVLKPGGKFICMEFSSVRDESLRTFYEAYSFGMIPLMGEFIAQDERELSVPRRVDQDVSKAGGAGGDHAGGGVQMRSTRKSYGGSGRFTQRVSNLIK